MSMGGLNASQRIQKSSSWISGFGFAAKVPKAAQRVAPLQAKADASLDVLKEEEF